MDVEPLAVDDVAEDVPSSDRMPTLPTWVTTSLSLGAMAGLAATISVVGGRVGIGRGDTGAVVAALLGAALTASLLFGVGRVIAAARPMAYRSLVVGTLLAGAGLALYASSGGFLRRDIEPLLPAWTEMADGALAAPSSPLEAACSAAPPNDAALLGFDPTHTTRCVGRGVVPDVRWIEDAGDGRWRGVLYTPRGAPTAWSQCIAPLEGPWWQTASADGAGCPSGFQAVGAP